MINPIRRAIQIKAPFAALWLGLCLAVGAACAQETPIAPSFWDPQRHLPRPETSAPRVIRFLTEDDYPPFHFVLSDGTLTGFDVDLARAICEELKTLCTIQPRRFDTLIDALNSGQGDALIAGLALSAENRVKVDFTAPYHKTPARFVAARNRLISDAIPETLAGRAIGVVARSSHEAFLKAFFPQSVIRSYETRDNVLSALKRGEVELAFGDGVVLSFWLNGEDANECCGFVGGPYTESRYFGEGVAIAVRKDSGALRGALDYALQRLSEKGVYTDLYLKYFPVSFW